MIILHSKNPIVGLLMIITLAVLTLISPEIYCQSQDYIITYKGDTVPGKIERFNITPKADFDTFKAVKRVGYEDEVRFIDGSGKETTYACGEIMGFYGAGLFFESLYVRDLNKEGRNMVFSEKIVSGTANLYKVVQSTLVRAATRETENTIQEYQYLAIAGMPTVRMSKSKKKLRELLSNYLSDDERTLAIINGKGFNKSFVQDILIDYNRRH